MESVKTTIEITDRLYREAKEYAARHGIPVRSVFERGLQLILEEQPPRKEFHLRTVTTKGEGLVCDEDWQTVRSLIYEGHGG